MNPGAPTWQRRVQSERQDWEERGIEVTLNVPKHGCCCERRAGLNISQTAGLLQIFFSLKQNRNHSKCFQRIVPNRETIIQWAAVDTRGQYSKVGRLVSDCAIETQAACSYSQDLHANIQPWSGNVSAHRLYVVPARSTYESGTCVSVRLV